MDMDRDKQNDAALDALFQAASTDTPRPSEDFLAKLVADAEDAIPAPAPVAPTRNAPSGFERLKGWFAVSGLSGAAALGVWIGFVMPDVVTTITPLSDEVFELSAYLPGADLAVLSE